MRLVARILVGAIGVLFIATGAACLFLPEGQAASRFLAPIGSQGLATIRADLGGFFIAGGTFGFLGAWRADVTMVLATLYMVFLAFFGRVVSLLVDGRGPEALKPMAIEAIIIVIFFVAWRVLKRSR